MGACSRITKSFHKNDFFKVTSLNGWAIVYSSKSVAQLIFWYLAILATIVLTILNVHQLVQHYRSEPIRYSMLLRSSTAGLAIPNITLNLKFPMLEFSQSLPSFISHRKCGTAHTLYEGWMKNASFQPLYFYFCNAVDDLMLLNADSNGYTPDGFYNVLLDAQQRELHRKLLENQLARLVHIDPLSSPLLLSDPVVLDNWRQQMQKNKEQLIDFWLTNPLREQKNQCPISREIQKLSDACLFQRPNDTLIELIMLNTLSMVDNHEEIIFPAVRNPVHKIFKSLKFSTDNLLNDVMDGLNSLFHLTVHPEGHVEFHEWKLNQIQHDYITELEQHFKLSLILPPGVEKLELKLYSYMSLWMKTVLSAWEEIFGIFVADPKTVLCPLSRLPLSEGIVVLWSAWLEYFNKYSELTVDIPHTEESLALPGGYQHQIEILPQMAFSSNIDLCSETSLSDCVRDCVIKSHVNSCGCIPWNHASHSDSNMLCNEKCMEANALECEEMCANENIQFCSLFMAKMDTHTVGTYWDDPVDEMLGLTLRFREILNFVLVTADYEMTGSTFFSLLGGSIQFWGAISITGLMHLVLYVCIKCCFPNHAENETESTERSNTENYIKSVEMKFDQSISEVSEEFEQEFGSRAGRLYNAWAKETPMIGFAFIAEAKSHSERAFWYSVIIIITIFASINLANLVDYFKEGFSRVDIVPRFKSNQSSIPNLTLYFTLPLCELVADPLDIRPLYDRDKLHSLSYMENLLIAIVSGALEDETLDDFQELIKNRLYEELTQDPWPALHDTKTYGGQLAHRNSQDLTTTLGTYHQDLTEILDGKAKHSALQLQKLVPTSVQSPFRIGQRDKLIYRLFLLHALKHGSTEFFGLQVFNDSWGFKLPEQGVSTKQLLSSTTDSLSQILHLSITEGAHLQLEDVQFQRSSIDTQNQYNYYEVRISTQIIIERKVQEIEIVAESLMKQWVYDYIYLMQTAGFDDWSSVLMQIHNGRLMFIAQWISYYMNVTIAKPSSPETSTQFFGSELRHEIPVSTKWQLEKDSCTGNETFDHCVRHCVADAHFNEYGCLPWHMHYIANGRPLCSKAIKHINTISCMTNCVKEVCERRVMEIGDIIPLDSLNREMFNFKLSLREKSHIKLIEKNDLTIALLLGELGGLLDLYLGLNLFAVVHVIVYLLRWSSKCSSKRKPSKGPKAILFKKLIAKLSAINLDLHWSIVKLRESAKKGSLKEEKETLNTKLRRSDFYSQTPITGFSFIADAGSKFEIIFWYTMIWLFSIATIYNVAGAVNNYTSKPTNLRALHLSDHQSHSIPNFTLQFQMPLLEFSDTNPTPIRMEQMHEAEVDESNYFACALSNPDNNYVMNLVQLNEMHQQWLNFNDWKNYPSSHKLPNHQFSTVQSMQQWLTIFKNASSSIQKFLHDNQNANMSELQSTLRSKFTDLLDEPMRKRSRNAFINFLMLDSFKSGVHPQVKLSNLLKNDPNSGVLNFDQIQNLSSAKELLNGRSAAQVYKQALDDLALMLHVDISGAEGSRIHLKDWTYEPRNPESILNYRLETLLMDQQLTLAVVIPRGTTELSLKIHAFSHLWLKSIYDTIVQYYSLLPHDTKCRGTDLNFIRDIEIYKFASTWWNTDVINILLKIQGTTELFLNRNVFRELTLRSAVSFHSQTDACLDGSFEHCMQMCDQKQFIEICGCSPWTSLYLAQMGDICTEPCALGPEPNNQCQAECEQKLQHPCHMNIYQALLTRPTTDETPNYFGPIYDILIHTQTQEISERLEYNEQYALTFAAFISQMGGLLDLWLGLNLLAVVHGLVHIIKVILAKCQFCKTVVKPLATHRQQTDVTAMSKVSKVLVEIDIVEQRLKKMIDDLSVSIKCELEQLRA